MLITSVVAVSLFSLVVPQKASAVVFVPVFDTAVFGELVIANTELAVINAQLTAVNTQLGYANTLTLTGYCAKEVGPGCIPVPLANADSIANIIIKQIASLMVKSVTNWVRSGFDGSPAFVADLKLYLEDLATSMAVNFASELIGSDICSFFPTGDIQALISLSTRGTQESTFGAKARCTVDDVIADAEGFFEGIASGDWIAFESVLTDGQNNPFGLYIESQLELGRRISEEQKRESTLLDWGRGFFTFEDEFGNAITPGAMIETQLGHAMGYDLRTLELADEFDELFQALLNQLLTQALGATGFLDADVNNPPPINTTAPAIFDAFSVGETIEIVVSTNVYSNPGGSVVGTQGAGIRGVITGTSELSGTTVLWPVNFDTGPDGWVSQTWIILATP